MQALGVLPPTPGGIRLEENVFNPYTHARQFHPQGLCTGRGITVCVSC
jgi:hypothetical protein